MKRQLFVLALVFLTLNIFADGYEVGDKATDFKLMGVDGKMVSMSDYDDAKGIVVIFTCNHCPYSVLYEDRIIALDKKYKKKGFPVIAINSNDSIRQPEDSFSNMIVRADEKDFSFPYLLDADQSIAKAYGATRTPHVFLLEKESNDYVVKYIGTIDDDAKSPLGVEEIFAADAIDAVLKGNNPDPDFTKAIGCTIKWAE